MTVYVYDACSDLILTTLATAFPQQTTNTVYDKMGRVTKTVNPDGTYTTDQYDAVGNLVTQTDAMGRVTQFIYDRRGRQIATIRPDGTIVTTSYNGGGRVIAQTDALGNTTRSRLRQARPRDPAGRALRQHFDGCRRGRQH